MSTTIDQRIVEMSFENHKFEKGILESKNSLKDFSNVLANTGTGKDFSGLEKSVQSVAQSFSVLEQVGIGALRRIGEAALNAGLNVFKGLAIAPITQGFTEMDLKMNSTQTIMASTGETLEVVNGHLQDLNEYSDKTIYSFANMTQSIGKFTNAGVKLDTAVMSIKGISNAAALAGANAEEASRAMYNFGQAISSGYVKLIDWKSIELANMATVEFKTQLLESAAAAGTVEKQANGMYKVLTTDMGGSKMEQTISATKNFNDSLSFQWMTTEALTGTLSNYADETTDIGRRAAKAATQVTTLSKLMSTLKESVGSGWSQSFELIFGDFNEARDLWSGMNETLGGSINAMSDMRNQLLSGGMSTGWKQFMKAGIKDTTEFGDILTVVAEEAGVDIHKIIEDTGSMEKAVRENWVTGDMLTETISRMSASIENLSVKELLNVGYTEKTRDELLALRDAMKSGKISADEFAKKMGAMSGRENIMAGLKNSVVALLTVLKPVSKAFDQIFPRTTADGLYKMTEIFKRFTQSLIITEETAKKIQRTFAGFFAVIDLGWQTVKFLASALYEIVGIFIPLSGNLLDMTASLGDFLVAMNQAVKQSGVFQYALLGVKITALTLKSILDTVGGKIKEFITTLLSSERPLEYLGIVIQKMFAGSINTLKTMVSWVSTKLLNAFSTVQKFLGSKFNFGDADSIGGILGVIKDFVVFLMSGANDTLSEFGRSLVDLDFSKIATFVTGGILLMFINQLTNLTGAMANLTNSANGFVTKFSKKLFASQTKFKDFAIGIGIISASLYMLAQVPFDNLKTGLFGLAGAMLVFVAAYGAVQAITVAASKKMGGTQTMQTAFSLTALAGGLAVMAAAIYTIGKIDKERVWDSVGVVTAMMGLLVAYQALSVAISLIPGTRSAIVKVAGMTAGLFGIVGIVVVLNSLPPGAIASGLIKLAGAMLVIAGIQALFALAAKISGGNKLSVNLLGMTLGVLSLVALMKVLSLLDAREVAAGITNLLMVGGVLSAIQLMFSLAGRVSKGAHVKTNIFAMQVGLASMIALTVIAGSLNQTKLQNGIGNIAKMGGIIVALEILTAVAARIGNGHKIQKILGSVTLTLSAFTVMIGILNIYKEETIDKGLKTIKKMVGIIVGLQLMTAVIGSLRGTAIGIGTMVGLTTMILAVTASLALLSMVDQEALKKAATSLSMAIFSVGIMAGGLGIMMAAFKNMSNDVLTLPKILKTLIPGFTILGTLLLGAIAFLGVVAVMEPMLNKASWNSLAKVTVGLAAIGTLAGAFSVLSKVPGLATDVRGLYNLIPGLVAMGAVVLATGVLFAVITPVLKDLNDVKWDSLSKFGAGLVLLGTLVASVALLNKSFAVLGAGLAPSLGILVAIAGVALIVGAFVGLGYLLNQMELSDLVGGIEKMVIVAEGIGRFFGAIGGGFSAELITGFGEGLVGFADAVKQIKPGSFEGIESLAKAILLMTTSALISGISNFINVGMNPGKVFALQIKGLVEGLKEISVADAMQASIVLTALVPMVKSLEVVANAAKNIPYSGGFVGAFLGNRDASVFGGQLAGFVNSLSGLSTILTSHAVDVLGLLAPMADNLKSLGKAANNIPEAGGFMETFFGNNNIDSFGTQLAAFIGIFSAIDVDSAVKPAVASILAMTPMMEKLKEFGIAANSIDETGGMGTWLMGDNSIDTFGNDIKGLIKTFGTMNQDQIAQSVANMTTLNASFLPGLSKFITLYNSLQATGGKIQEWGGTSSFVNLAKEIKSFVGELKGVDFRIIQPAMDSLNQINDSFKLVGQGIVSSAIASIQVNKVPFQVAIISMLIDATKLIYASRDLVSDAMLSIFDKAIKDSDKYIKEFRELGQNLAEGLRDGITGGKNIATTAAINMAENVAAGTRMAFEVNSPSKVFAEIGGWLPVGLGNGIQDNKKVAILASTAMADDVTIAATANMSKYPMFGKLIPEGMEKGITDAKSKLLTTAKNLGLDTSNMALSGVLSASGNTEGAGTKIISDLISKLTGGKVSLTDTAKKIGDAATSGFSAGVSDSKVTDKVKGVAKDAFQVFKESIDKRREYNQMSAWEEILAWEGFTKKYAAGTEIRMKADKQVAQLRYEYSKSWIDKEKYYKRMSLEQELAAWERVQVRYKAGHEYRMQAEREVFRLKEEIWQAEYQNSMASIDEEKFYGRLNLSQELKAWENILTTTKDGSEERKKVNREIFRLESEIQDQTTAYEESLQDLDEERNDKRAKLDQEYYDKSKDLNERMKRDIQSLTDEYENAVDAREKTLYSTYGLFDKVERPKYTSGFELINNLEDQNAAFDAWQNSIGALTAKGIDKGLIEELRNMGPKAISQINALNNLSDSELSRYVDLWQKKGQEAKDQATSELQGLKDANALKIQEITAQTEEELAYYKGVWKDSLKAVDEESRIKLNAIETSWKNSIGSMTAGGISTIQSFRLQWFGEIAQMVTDTQAQMAQLASISSQKMPTKIAQVASTIAPIINTALSKNIKTDSVGKQVVNGITAGIKQTAPKVYSVTANMGSGISKTLNTALRVESPSKETMWTGENVVLGLVEGIRKTVGKAMTASSGLGETVLTALSSSMNTVPDLLATDMGAVTITPVIDLSGVRSGMAAVNSMLNGASGLDLTNTMNLLPKGTPVNQNGILTEIRNGLSGITNPEVDLTGKLTVEVVNDKGEIVGIAETAIKDLLRRESR